MESTWAAVTRRRDEGSLPAQRTDGLRIALAIEGGGMRGVVAAGMAAALEEQGLLPAFDAVYGSSAGCITGVWLLSDNPQGVRGWTDPQWARQMIGPGGLVRGRPFMDVSRLIDDIYVHQVGLNYASVLENDITFHPLATSATTGAAVDLHPTIATVEDLRRAIRASCALPIVAGRPVTVAGERYSDAGLSEVAGSATAAAAGATHILALRTRHADYVRPPEANGWRRHVLRTALTLTGHSDAIARAALSRSRSAEADRAFSLAESMSGAAGTVSLKTVWPDPELELPSRAERDGARLTAAFEGGRRSLRATAAVHGAGGGG